ncbi:MAG: MtrB/PioB family decaheme-associated outer membrane protein [Gammaproteobacteria bacterium]|nr:MtrB/PioB family decaheme-associated outer membrane protein [Gammaproteobacteria bacterium]
MRMHKKILIAILYLAASPLWAEDDPFSFGPSDGGLSLEAPAPPPPNRPKSELEIGLAYINRDSFKFGEYTGQEEKGPYVIGNVDIHRRGAFDSRTFDSDGALYWILRGRNLGLTSREMEVETGVQGDYKVGMSYDQLPKFQTDTAKTIFRGVGGDTLTLPPGWVRADETSDMTELNNSLHELKVSHERKKYGMEFSKFFSRGWEFSAKYHRETKEGKKLVGAIIESWDFDDSFHEPTVIIPEPIDYVTQQVDVKLSFTGKKSQFEGGYSVSLFDNHKDSLIWENPFSAIGGTPETRGRIGLPPDNQFHQLKAIWGYNFAPNTRLTAHGTFGRMTQDERFLPYTINPDLAGSGLPRSSLNGRVDTLSFYTKLFSRYGNALNWVASYRYEDRDNRTSRASYIGYGDAADQGGVANARTNLPFSFKQNQFKLDATYEWFYRTYLQGGYEYTQMERTLSEVKKNQEHLYRLEIRRNAFDSLTGGIRFLQAYRRGSSYRTTALQTATGGEHSMIHPLQRKFYLASKNRTQGGGFMELDPIEAVTLQLSIDLYEDDYLKSKMGLRKSMGQVYAIDATMVPKKDITTYAFYTYEHSYSDQKERAFETVAESNDPRRDWNKKTREGIDTLGAGFKWGPFLDRWDTGADYTYARSRGKGPVKTGSALDAPDPPIRMLTTELHRLDVFLKYKIKESLSAKMNVLYEKFSSRDYAVDKIQLNEIDTILITGEKSPDYSVSVIGLSLLYDF